MSGVLHFRNKRIKKESKDCTRQRPQILLTQKCKPELQAVFLNVKKTNKQTKKRNKGRSTRTRMFNIL